ncbi:hypothetical protein BKA62DRAFT_586505, partial [Auriculariales sp. MPI-PUGE-AT-0066]
LTRLSRSKSTETGRKITNYLRVYHTQPLDAAIGRLLATPGFEQQLAVYKRSLPATPPTVLTDMWHGPELNTFPWQHPTGQNELRLIFSLTIDWFNAEGSSRRGKHWSVGAIYLTILDLPPHAHHLPENMILVGLIP